VDLRERSSSQWFGGEFGEGAGNRKPDCRLDFCDGYFRREGRYVFTELLQFGQDVIGNQVRPSADDLSELDKRRAEFFESQSDSLGAGERLLRASPFEKNAATPAEVASHVQTLDEISESVVKQNADNLPHSTEVSDKSKRS
jgi:hypothetical protein